MTTADDAARGPRLTPRRTSPTRPARRRQGRLVVADQRRRAASTPTRLDALVDALAAPRLAGGEVVLVSSGAIAAGLAPLGLPDGPRDLATQQAAASVGQGAARRALHRGVRARTGCTVGQVLLTADDVIRRGHYAQRAAHARPAARPRHRPDRQRERHRRHRTRSASATTTGWPPWSRTSSHADALVLLSDVDALYDGPPVAARRPAGARRSAAPRTSTGIDDRRRPARRGSGTGGMVTKVEAAAHRDGGGHPDRAHLRRARRRGAGRRGRRHVVRADRRGARRTPAALARPRRDARAGRLVLDDGAVARGRRAPHVAAAGRDRRRSRASFAAGDPVDLVRPGRRGSSPAGW